MNNDIVRGLLRRKPDVDIVRVQDVSLSGADDPTILEWAAQEDALHLALTEAGEAEYFCTCDDRPRHQAERIEDLAVRVVSSVELVQEIEE